jgi:hypothetical protein
MSKLRDTFSDFAGYGNILILCRNMQGTFPFLTTFYTLLFQYTERSAREDSEREDGLELYAWCFTCF